MIALYIIGGIIAFFAILLSFNVSLRVIFNSSAKDEMNIYAKIGFYKIYIVPEKIKKEKRIKKVSKKKEKTVKTTEEIKKEEPKKEKKKYSIPEIFNVVKDIGSVLLKRLKKHLRFKINKINIILASDDAEKTAILYGAAIQSAYYLYEFLDHNFKLKNKRDSIKIIPDFSKIQTSFDIDVKFYIKISHILALAIAAAMKFVKFWFKSGKTKKIET